MASAWLASTRAVVKAKKLANYGHTMMRKQGTCCLEKEIMQGTMRGARRRGRPHTAWMDNIKTWTGLTMEESVRMAEDRDKWRKYFHGVANPRIEDDWRTEQNRTYRYTRPRLRDARMKASVILNIHIISTCLYLHYIIIRCVIFQCGEVLFLEWKPNLTLAY